MDTIDATNDNWSSTSDMMSLFERLGAISLNNGSLDAALHRDLDRKPYTAHVNPTAGGGVALAEVYDASTSATPSTPRLVNISGGLRWTRATMC